MKNVGGDDALAGFCVLRNAAWYPDYTPNSHATQREGYARLHALQDDGRRYKAINPLIFLSSRSPRSALTRRRVTIRSVFLLSVVERASCH